MVSAESVVRNWGYVGAGLTVVLALMSFILAILTVVAMPDTASQNSKTSARNMAIVVMVLSVGFLALAVYAFRKIRNGNKQFVATVSQLRGTNQSWNYRNQAVGTKAPATEMVPLLPSSPPAGPLAYNRQTMPPAGPVAYGTAAYNTRPIPPAMPAANGNTVIGATISTRPVQRPQATPAVLPGPQTMQAVPPGTQASGFF